ncbi:unnamed protein product, partial [Lampetra fluviatilis]
RARVVVPRTPPDSSEVWGFVMARPSGSLHDSRAASVRPRASVCGSVLGFARSAITEICSAAIERLGKKKNNRHCGGPKQQQRGATLRATLARKLTVPLLYKRIVIRR